MLFYPWRKEAQIIAECETYEERYRQVEEQIEDKKAEYEHKAHELDDAEELLANKEDESMWDTLAPCTIHIDPRDKQIEGQYVPRLHVAPARGSNPRGESDSPFFHRVTTIF